MAVEERKGRRRTLMAGAGLAVTIGLAAAAVPTPALAQTAASGTPEGMSGAGRRWSATRWTGRTRLAVR